MTLEALHLLMPPPEHPVGVPTDSDFARAVDLGVAGFPRDFVAFLASYGTGCIDQFIWIFSPGSKNKNLNLLYQIPLQLGVLRELRAEGDEKCPYSVFPQREGLLPFGITDNGDVLYWKTAQASADWRIVVAESRGPTFEEFEGTMTEFLIAVLMKRHRVGAFPEDFPSAQPKFSPI